MSKKNIFLCIFAVAALVVGTFLFKNRDKNKSESVLVERGSISQEVQVTGKVKAAQDVDLAFEMTGRVERVLASVGSRVSPGQLLAGLDQSDLLAELANADAVIQTESAKLEELKRGTRVEELAIQKVKVENARAVLEDSKQNLLDKIEDGYTKIDNAVYNESDQLFDNPRTNPVFKLSLNDSSLKGALATARQGLEPALISWKGRIRVIRSTDVSSATIQEYKGVLSMARSFLELVGDGTNSASPNAQFSQSALDVYRASISSARSSVNTAITNLSAADEKQRNAQSALLLAENELVLKNAGSTKEAIAAQEASVASARAKAQSIQAKISKTIIRAPIYGVVTKADFTQGETAQSGVVGISLISDTNLQIEANISEINIGSISRDNPVKVTFDAFSGEALEGVVVYVDPGETIVDGVVNFKTTVVLKKSDQRLKSGLTANLIIETMRKDSVLRVPQSAIIKRNQKLFVQRTRGDQVEDVEVTTGIMSNDGFTEVLSGVAEGDSIVRSPGK